MEKLQVLKDVFGHDSFRGGQEPLIDAILGGRDVLAVMPTGSGKSVCYQVPALMMDGITLVISPLISLMSDQVMALKAAGVPAAYLNSSLSPSQQAEAIRRARGGAYKLIYVAPERLMLPSFIEFAQCAEISLLAIDEAHCISQWGQDFRPSYTRIAAFTQLLPERPVIAAFTATATQTVKDDIAKQLCLNHPYTVTTGFDRPNLHFAAHRPSNRFAALCQFLSDYRDESGIVYCNSRKTVEQVCDKLRDEGFTATRYHAGLTPEERKRNQEYFQYDRVHVMVATNAFGMGIDKPNVRFVVHYNMPRDLEGYYQEAGRAGRDGGEAECLLLYNPQDIITAKYLITHGKKDAEIDARLRAQLEARDMQRLQQMIAYTTGGTCLRHYLLDYFGEKTAMHHCDKCSVCDGAPFEIDTGTQRSHSWRTGEADSEESRARRAISRKEKRRGESDLDSWERALLDSLKELRKLIAQMMHYPAYVVFSDATLLDMVRKRPQSEEALLRVSGVGQHKLERFGECFLAVLRDGKEPNDAAFLFNPVSSGRRGSSGAKAAIHAQRAGESWTPEEDQQLEDEFLDSMNVQQMARLHQRANGDIRKRLRHLGLIDDME